MNNQEQEQVPLFQSQPYAYKAKKLPPKPEVIDVGENLAAPTQAGVTVQLGINVG